MDPQLRERFNADFTEARFAELCQISNSAERWPVDFRIAESPIFLTDAFRDEVVGASDAIVAQLRTPEFAQHAETAIPPGLEVPNETSHPTFLQVDFAICRGLDGALTPRLIELQGFPSLYCFQPLLLNAMRAAYPAIPEDWTAYFGGLDNDSYRELLREIIVGDAAPENVVLLEIEPEKQNTRIDFACTESMLGVAPLDLAAVTKRGRQLFYRNGEREVRIERIYNRVIFDELTRRPDLHLDFSFQDDIDVQWVGHPNWYFRISKHSLPFLQTPHTAPAYFADALPAGESLSDYVLKPLYSFAGAGVNLNPTREEVAALPDPHAWIFQHKVEYADFVSTPDGPLSKAEIRMMFVWPDGGEPMLVNNLVRMSQGAMMGVKFNKNKTWVGSSIALHR